MTDWAVGDLAVCVDDTPIAAYGLCRCRSGAAYRVAGITPAGRAPCHRCGACCGLFLVGLESISRHGFAGCRFRKIRPDEHEACEQEFVTLLKRRKVPETADADIAFIRRCREIDRLQNIVWADEAEREAGVANNAPVANQ